MFVLSVGRASRLRFAVARRLLLLERTASPRDIEGTSIKPALRCGSPGRPEATGDISRVPGRASVASPRTRVDRCAPQRFKRFSIVPSKVVPTVVAPSILAPLPASSASGCPHLRAANT